MAYRFDADEIAHRMNEAREDTFRLFDVVISEADLRRPPAEGFRPILWHMGHVGAFEHYWILQRVKGDPTISTRYDAIFDPIKTPREDANNLPPLPEIKDYLARVRRDALSFLATIRADSNDPMLRDGYVFNLVLEHEYQHQETIAYLLQLLEPELKQRPVVSGQWPVTAHMSEPALLNSEPRTRNSEMSEMVRIIGGPFQIGSRGYPFAYDNEQPPQTVELEEFRIDRFP